jgi:N-acetylneuraminic acid mutarotase
LVTHPTAKEDPVRYHALLRSALVLGTGWLVGCADQNTTEPTGTPEPATASPELAVASNSWIIRANMPANRTGLAAATVTNAAGQSIVYAIGGINPNGVPVNIVTAYNVATNTWTFRRPLPQPLAGSNGAGVINGKIYVSGGYSDYGGLRPGSQLLVYDPATNAWTRKSDIPAVTDPTYGDRSYAAGGGVTGVIGGKLYVVSGCFQAQDPWGYFETCNALFFRYTPATNKWVRLPSPFAGAVGPSIGGVIAGKFYVMAGSPWTREAQMAVYDPATNRWTPKNPLGLSRPGAASTVLGSKLYVMGGRRYNAQTDAMETLDITTVYDPATNAWTRRAPLPSPRIGIAATKVFLNGQPRLEVVGGVAPRNNIQYIP